MALIEQLQPYDTTAPRRHFGDRKRVARLTGFYDINESVRKIVGRFEPFV